MNENHRKSCVDKANCLMLYLYYQLDDYSIFIENNLFCFSSNTL